MAPDPAIHGNLNAPAGARLRLRTLVLIRWVAVVGQTAAGLVGVVDDAFVEPDTELCHCGVSTEVLIG